MNFDEYQGKGEARYAEFACIVRDILEKAINRAEGVPRPQSIQCRAKEASHLKPKLEARGLLQSSSVEYEIKDLAGVRLIFYTNTDADRFLNSRLIPENFAVDWDHTRIHHPTEENANQRYQAIHYTVSLNESRTALAEYAKFKGLRCEIQIQTILIHAWAETSHDITYKRFEGKGFGQQAISSIEARLNKIMDKYLLPAGYEFQKVQHDFQRLIQGKELFDRGTIEALDACANNNDRYEILRSLRQYVLPNYDDVAAIYPELRAGLLRAVDNASVTETQPVETPFGNLDGHTAADVIKLAVGIISDLRYLDVGATLRTLGDIFQASNDAEVRKEVERGIEELAGYDLEVWRQAGPAVQLALVSATDELTSEERDALWPLLHIIWRECLNAELRGTTWSADAVSISRDAVPAVDDLSTIRRTSIDGLLEFYDKAPDVEDKRSILNSLWAATRLPSQAGCSNDLRKIVMRDSKRIVDEITARLDAERCEILASVERHLLFEHERAQQIASATDDRFECKALAKDLDVAILKFRNRVNADTGFVRYKTLVGARYLEAGTHLAALARQWRISAMEDERLLGAILDKAVFKEDDIAVMECVVAVIARHSEAPEPLIESCFQPGLRYLTARNDARWVNCAWFIPEAKTFFAQLSAPTTGLVLENLMAVPRIDTHAEWILAYIAEGHAAAIWRFLGRRIIEEETGRDPEGRYEAIPYQFHQLPKILSQDVASAVRATRGLYTPDDTLFQFRGARLLSAMFPAFPENLAHELAALAATGTDEDVGFILQVLRAYQGQQTTHEVAKELVARLPEDDERVKIAEICLQSTGVISGEFGFVETYRSRKAQIETWLTDARPKVRSFARRFVRRLEQSIAAEQRRAEQDKEMRRRQYEDPEEE